MHRKCIGIFALLVLLSSIAHAGSAPKELFGKSVVLIWNENRTYRDRAARPSEGFSVVLTGYVSTTGRLFTRTSLIGAMHGSHGPQDNEVAEHAPGGERASNLNSHSEFQGRTLVMTAQFDS